MKKLLSTFFVLVLALSTFAVTASADNVTLRKPVRCSVIIGSDTYVTNVKDSNLIITGREIDATKMADATKPIGSVASATIKFQPVNVSGDVYTLGGATSQLKTNFIWQFDFSLASDETNTIPTANDKFRMQFGSSWKNKISFIGIGNNAEGQALYYIQWNATPDAYVNEPVISTTSSDYALVAGNTYRMKIEADFDSDKVYVTLINPYLNSDGTKKDVMSWTDAYTRTTTSKASLGFSLASAADVKNTDKRFGISMYDTTGKVKFTMSNETFYMDRIYAVTPTLSVENNNVTANANAINIPNFNYYGKLPTVFCAVYKDNELVKCERNEATASGLAALTDSEYSATVTDLADGTYTVKAFVWNSVDEMQPYNCLVTKTLNVSGGTGSFEE